jgi:hypothetical protein
MAKQTVTVGNAIIVLADNTDPFNDGYTSGYLEFYNEGHRPPFPLTSHMIRDHLMMIINKSSFSDLWKAGRVTGWLEALMENSRKLSGVLFQRNG